MSTLTVRRYMTPSPHTIGAEQTLATAARLFREHQIRHLPVLTAGRLVGMLTERDLALVEALRAVDAEKLLVAEAMTQGAYATSPDTSLEWVALEMARAQVRLCRGGRSRESRRRAHDHRCTAGATRRARQVAAPSSSVADALGAGLVRGDGPRLAMPQSMARRRVLIVDREANARCALAELLREVGYDVATVARVADAWPSSRRFRPDAILYAWRPGASLELIAAAHAWPEPPAIALMSTYPPPCDLVLPCFMRPIAVDELLAALERMIPRRESPANPARD